MKYVPGKNNYRATIASRGYENSFEATYLKQQMFHMARPFLIANFEFWPFIISSFTQRPLLRAEIEFFTNYHGLRIPIY